MNLQSTMNQVLRANGSFTIIDESRSTVLPGIVTSKVIETSQVLAEELCAGRDCDN